MYLPMLQQWLHRLEWSFHLIFRDSHWYGSRLYQTQRAWGRYRCQSWWHFVNPLPSYKGSRWYGQYVKIKTNSDGNGIQNGGIIASYFLKVDLMCRHSMNKPSACASTWNIFRCFFGCLKFQICVNDMFISARQRPEWSWWVWECACSCSWECLQVEWFVWISNATAEIPCLSVLLMSISNCSNGTVCEAGWAKFPVNARSIKAPAAISPLIPE